MHIHIANIGKSPEPVLNAVRWIGNIDAIYLLYSEFEDIPDIAEESRRSLMKIGYDCETIRISGFDFQEIIDKIYRIYNETKNKGADYSINITGGTNLMAAASCSAAFFMKAKIYYAKRPLTESDRPTSDCLIEVPTPKIPDIQHLKNHDREILKYLYENENGSSRGISESLGIHPVIGGRYINHLEDMELVRSKTNPIDKRMKIIELTNQGKMIAGWFV